MLEASPTIAGRISLKTCRTNGSSSRTSDRETYPGAEMMPHFIRGIFLSAFFAVTSDYYPRKLQQYPRNR